jgi:hypothetical protein
VGRGKTGISREKGKASPLEALFAHRLDHDRLAAGFCKCPGKNLVVEEPDLARGETPLLEDFLQFFSQQ